MFPEPVLLPGAIATALACLTMAAVTLRRSGVLRTIERLWREHATVQLAREQRRMASRLPPGTELTHTTSGGPRLVIRTDAQRLDTTTGDDE